MNFIVNESPEKLRGGYYTDATLAEYLLRWVSGIRPRTLLEPSCGDGAFFRPLHGGISIPSLTHVVGCELEPGEATKAAKTLSQLPDLSGVVEMADFLGWVLPRLDDPPEFDAAVGNPPFIRYQYLSAGLQSRAETLIRRFGLRFTKHTNAWVPFVIGALNRLRPGGRLAMVVPAELLHVLHAESVRQYLLRECSRVLVLDPEELWFDGALQGVVLLLAEKRSGDVGVKRFGEVAITRIGGREFLAGSPEEHFRQAEYVSGEALPAKWMLALLTARERGVLRGLAEARGVRAFQEVATVQVGIVTGANAFFLVPDEVVEANDLDAYAHPMFGRSDHVAGVIYDDASHAENRRRGVPTNFLWFNGTPRDQLGLGAARYIASGEAQGLHNRFKCRIRQPWYSVPSVFTAPIGMLKRSHDYPRLVLNTAKAFTTDTAYRITSRGIDDARLVYSFVNSLTALSAELEGRHYGGGVLELVPSEINRLLLPLPESTALRLEALDALCRRGADPGSVFEAQDRVLLAGVGLTLADIREVQAAWWKLRNRRQRASEDSEDGAVNGEEEGSSPRGAGVAAVPPPAK